MYLTRVQLDPRRGGGRLLASPGRIHAAIEGAVPVEEGFRRVLWRVETSNPLQPILYLLTPSRPVLESLLTQAGMQGSVPLTKPYDAVLEGVELGRRYRFRMVANPTRDVATTRGARSRRVGCVTPQHQLEWLTRKGEWGGFRVTQNSLEEPNVSLSVTDRVTFPRKGSEVTLVRVQFDGVLEVTDPEAFRHSLVTGVGRGRAYGCGLLTLARAS